MTPDELPRLMDDGSTASPLLRELLASAEGDSPTVHDLGRLSRGLAPVLAPGASAPGLAGTKPLLVAGKVKSLLVVAVLGAAATTTYVATRAPRGAVKTAPATSVVVTIPSVPESATPPSAEPSPAVNPPVGASARAPAGSARTPRSAKAPAASAPEAPVPLESETALLGQALTALRAHDSRGALALVERQRTEYPSGAYTEEFRRIEIEALVLGGRLDSARAHATRFFHDYPRSAHRARIEALVGSGQP